ncbi:superoxide dismutase family protein [Zeaxanthinibacter sp. PT1]|uniref:superoxide dismutase family protein n=1 Tax=Zeaxanthinibacter TaxID=561554 RepID=UPI002349B385|nr:superoxide dismutase family protein [Zeaxanthinibacter sp. PT1]MDC6352270.1 superoxide dismutase family protein [Zeaxanthinibacter sp. PT1]
MKTLRVLIAGLFLFLTYQCKEAKKENEAASEDMEVKKEEVIKEVKVVKFTMEPKSDSDVKGDVTFREEDGKVMMTANLSGLSEGEHAIHIHENADCSAADGSSAGGHWNPTAEPHGKWGAEEGFHRGDIGNFTADADGNATVEFSTDMWCLGCEDETKNLMGKAVIVHQGTDDFTSQPSGAAGARVSCTGIIQ